MCGIFGAIGHRINPGIIRALAIANRERGTDSLGFFSNTGKFVKRADDPLDCLGDKDIADFIDKSCYKGWFLAGHTRNATYGNVTDENAHPFRYGRILASHNGIVRVPRKLTYGVDSEYLVDSLNVANGDYQAAFANVDGYWGLTWFDGSDFYLQSHCNDIAIGRDKYGVWYYSSDYRHLDACARPTRNLRVISNGETIRFTCKLGKYTECAKFRSTVRIVKVVKSIKTSKADKTGTTPKTDCAENDPFYVGDDKGAWSRADDWSEYTEEFN
jgi:glutamine phosphoribosylpyrophosphate amidotransferase